MPAIAPSRLLSDAPFGVSGDEAGAAVHDVLESIGDTCPKCPPDR
jgi:hypothetical protein